MGGVEQLIAQLYALQRDFRAIEKERDRLKKALEQVATILSGCDFGDGIDALDVAASALFPEDSDESPTHQ